MKKSKKITKLKRKFSYLKEDYECLDERVSKIEKIKRRKQKNSMKLMRISITVSFAILASLAIYRTFFHN
jgi:hypothetical protein